MDVSIEIQKELIEAIGAIKDSKSFWESPFAVGLLTAFAAISASLIQRWQAFRLQERQSQIEKKMRVHELQLSALKSLTLIEYRITPIDEPHPGADVYEWLAPVVESLSNIVSELDLYLKDHSYVSPNEVVSHIHAAINIANEHKWGAIISGSPDYEPSKQEINAVLELINELSEATKSFKSILGVTD